ncbi:RNA polymerase sigma factor [Hufsiella ginkgonis]|uniref:Sigma-70 family RNA polymerase sigma factor n=1 Tax=Hufsiella ginkgonis TaxID=2695274 RepID=A0A7K1XW90_9SPHI|nr:sigma-70 family RNA polymerase sigma factor [Hufsiella ginkgonis]MXV15254.1 sigma-70 family RNA polymerase sigma factor [Hufsiella ginkgonis]
MSTNKEEQLQLLVASCREGDRKAQETIFSLFSRKMFAVCLRYCRDHDEAEDVMIMGFTKVFTRIDAYKGEGSFEGWIRRIMVNSALTEYRKNAKRMYTVDIDAVQPDTEAVAYQDDTTEMKYLLSLIQGLPGHLRIAFNMFVIEGYSHKEIGEILGITEDLSKIHVFRARKQLQQKIRNAEPVFCA